jgi:hypothetical protein
VKHKSESVCFSCKVVKNTGVYHCVICQRCIKVPVIQHYDHHCKWLNNCVGENNLKPFTGFLIISLGDLFIAFLMGQNFLETSSGEISLNSIFLFMILALCAMMIVLISPITFLQVTNSINATTTSDRFSKKSVQSLNTSVFRESFMNDSFED